MKSSLPIRVALEAAYCIMLASFVFGQEVDTAWTRFYSGPAMQSDIAYDVMVDDSDNVYVTGGSAASGHTFFDSDVYTIKYGPGGDTLWERRFNSVGDNSEYGQFLARAPGDHFFIVGGTNAGGNQQILIMKYTLDGDTVWTRSFLGAGNANAYAKEIATDTSGRLWITGSATNGIDLDYITLLYDADGNLQWSDQYDAAGSDDYAYAVATDGAGGAFVTGTINVNDTLDVYTVMYASDGSVTATATYDGPWGLNEQGVDIVYDTAGYVYVAGSAQEVVGNNHIILIKYDLNGDTVWTRLFMSPETGSNAAYFAAQNSTGDIIVSSVMQVTSTAVAVGVINCSSSGTHNWTSYFSPRITPRDMELDAGDNIYITGDGLPPGGLIWTDWATLKMDPDGDTVWSRWLLAPIFSDAFIIPYGMALDNSNGVIVTGFVAPPPDRYYCTRKYTQPFSGVPGDADGDGSVSVSDAVFIVSYVFKGGPPPNPLAAADANCDGSVNVADAVYVINYVFKGGPAPANCG